MTVYTGFDDVAYSPCGIPYVHGKEIDSFERLFLASKQAYVDAGIDVHYNADVTKVDVSRKVVEVAGEGEVSWDTLVLATGFDYADPGVPGGDLGGLYYVKNIREAIEWDKVLDTVKSAVVIEASPLGVEMVTALAHRGIETHLVDPSPWPMSEIADPDIMAPVEESWGELGVTTHFNTTLEGLPRRRPGAGSADVRRRDQGRPRRGLHPQGAQQRARRRGRPQDRLHRRLHRRRADGDLGPGVFAAGDCTEIPHGLTGVPLQGLTGSHAYAQGKTAGINAAAGRRAYNAVYVPWGTRGGQVDHRRCVLRRDHRDRAGHPVRRGRARRASPAPATTRASSPSRSSCSPSPARLRLIGAQMVGGEGIKERADFLAMAIKFGLTLHDLATHGERLLAGDRRAQRADRRGRPKWCRRAAEELNDVLLPVAAEQLPSTTC